MVRLRVEVQTVRGWSSPGWGELERSFQEGGVVDLPRRIA